MISGRERVYLRRLTAAGELHEQRPPDLFHESEVLGRRKSHLILVIQRKASRLKIDIPPDLEAKSQLELETIRVAFSKRIAESKRPPAEGLAA